MPSLKGLALGVGAVIAVGYIAVKTGAARGLSDMAQAITQTFMSPLKGIGEGLGIMGEGVSTFLSPTIAPQIAPTFDWSGWKPFGNGNGAGNGNGNGVRDEDRTLNGNGAINGNGNGLYRVSEAAMGGLELRGKIPPFINGRKEDRTERTRYIAL